MAKVVCVLYDEPIGGYPQPYARDDIPRLERYPGGQTLPTPEMIDFKPGQLLGSVSGALGLRKVLEERGHTLIVTSDAGWLAASSLRRSRGSARPGWTGPGNGCSP